VIVTVTLNAALEVAYAAGRVSWESVNEVSRARYRAGGRGIAVARVLHIFGHEVVAAGLAGGGTGELIREELARSGIACDFTAIGRDSRRVITVDEMTGAGEEGSGRGRGGGRAMRFREPGAYVTTEELGRFAADYRRLLADATAVVLCGSLPAGLPSEMYGSLVTYAAEAGVAVILDAGGDELLHGARRRPELVIPDARASGGQTADAALIGSGVGAVARPSDALVRVTTPSAGWNAFIAGENAPGPGSRGALVAGLVPGLLLGWSWPDRLRHALALAGSAGASGEVDLSGYEQLLDKVQVDAVL
jgi:fructose-1-phosphate kinase PfkB-like protein